MLSWSRPSLKTRGIVIDLETNSLFHRVSRVLLGFLKFKTQDEKYKREHNTDSQARPPDGAVVDVVGGGGDDIRHERPDDESPVDHGVRK